VTVKACGVPRLAATELRNWIRNPGFGANLATTGSMGSKCLLQNAAGVAKQMRTYPLAPAAKTSAERREQEPRARARANAGREAQRYRQAGAHREKPHTFLRRLHRNNGPLLQVGILKG